MSEDEVQEHLEEEDTSEEEKSEVAQLFHHALTEHMSEEEASAYLVGFNEPQWEEIPREQLFAHIPQEKMGKDLMVTSYHPDRAVREASLAKKDQWRPTSDGEVTYMASNAFEVYFGAPLEITEAFSKIRTLSESTVLTARIVLGLWNSRRYNKQISQEGSVAILLDEILQWQGIQKHSRQVGAEKRYTDGYRPEHRRRVQQDLALLAACQVRGTTKIVLRGKATPIQVDGPYLRYDTVSRRGPDGEEFVLGFLLAPGGWIGTYEEQQNETLASIDRRIFTLNPQNDRYALRLALYLTERWREQAKQGNFSEPITISDLLNASMIEIDLKNLNKLAQGVEKALCILEQMGIVGKHVCLSGFHIGVRLTTTDQWETNTCMKVHEPGQENACVTGKHLARWSKEWLGGTWEILPPTDLIRAYEETLQAGKKKRPRKRLAPPS